MTVVGAGTRLEVAVGEDGTYTVPLPPGRYTTRGSSPGYLDGRGGCRSSGEVVVVAGGTVVVDTVCPVR